MTWSIGMLTLGSTLFVWRGTSAPRSNEDKPALAVQRVIEYKLEGPVQVSLEAVDRTIQNSRACGRGFMAATSPSPYLQTQSGSSVISILLL